MSDAGVCSVCHAAYPAGARFCPACARPVGPGDPTKPEGATMAGVLPPPERLGPGVLLEGKYEIREHLGAGGFGDVFRVRHLMLERDFALKTLHASLVQD